jgi:dTDP-4-dehydrorhamnose reductase
VSKAAGESAVLVESHDALIVRGSGMFGHAASSGKGGNFVETMIAKARRGEPISVVSDQVFSPTSTRDMAEKMLALLEHRAPPGVFHCANSGSCSWYEFARTTLEIAGIRADLTPRLTGETVVRRPACSVLLDTRSADLGLPAQRPWEEALAWYLRARPADASVPEADGPRSGAPTDRPSATLAVRHQQG